MCCGSKSHNTVMTPHWQAGWARLVRKMRSICIHVWSMTPETIWKRIGTDRQSVRAMMRWRVGCTREEQRRDKSVLGHTHKKVLDGPKG